MILAKLPTVKKLIDEPRKKDREFWGLNRKEDFNGHNYNMYRTWLEMQIRYLEKREKRSSR